ncbi:hypothetical protein BN1002_00237 [Bacillus sp. B-jedd]|nr:hypothetical protein BN1002_00237 [Bacillus sp. B-jedd]
MGGGAPLKNKLLLRAAGVLTAFLFIYAGVTYWDQTSQAAVITDSVKFENRESAVSENDIKHLEKLGFSKIAITHMTAKEVAQFAEINGKVVDEREHYQRFSKNNSKVLSKKKYLSLLKSYAESPIPRVSTLEKVSTKLLHEEGRKFTLITEHHFDYITGPIKPMEIEIQPGEDYMINDQQARQIWWKSPTLGSKKVIAGTEKVGTTGKTVTMNDFEVWENDYSYPSMYYSVPWVQPGLLEDIVGLHFTTVTRFELPEETNFATIFVQGMNPYLSEHLQYEIK